MTVSEPIRCFTGAELAAMKLPPTAPEPKTLPTWGEIVTMAPALRGLEDLATLYHRTRPDDIRAWGTIKLLFLPHVGFEAQRYELRTSAAYNVAYDHLLAVYETGRAA